MEYSHFKLEDTSFLEGKGISFICCWTRTQAGSVSYKQQVNKYLVFFLVWFLPFALSLSLAPPFLQRWSLDGILKAHELFLFVQLTFACCCYCWTCDRKLVFDINFHQCWELSEDVTVGGQFHIDFPLKVSDHVLLLLVEGL